MNAAFCSELFINSCKWEEKEGREDVHPGLGGNLSLDPPEWQPSVLTTTPRVANLLGKEKVGKANSNFSQCFIPPKTWGQFQKC